jgi:mannose-6-phosphate isomerase|tara:strand:+ start:116 stop:457 length:342 start_codon:yes stop_codon:yes gene_type:complete
MNKIIKKPWGSEEIIEINKKFMFKKLYMKKNHQCSLQLHNIKKESVFVLSGKLKVMLKKNKKIISKILTKGQNILIKPKTIHRMKAITNCTYLEASTPEINDVVRIEDDYKRV